MIPFDHTHADLAPVLQGAVSERGVDYGLLATRRAALDAYLDRVGQADTAGWTDAQKLALYVNAYNAHTLALMLDAGPPASIMELDGGKVWDTRRFLVAGERLTLNELENARARKLADGRVHAVLNCASKGCPPLPPRPLAADGLEAQLDTAARRWASTNAFVVAEGRLQLSKVFDWYGEDFAKEVRGDLPNLEGDAEAAAWFLSRFVDEPTKAALTSGRLTATWAEYDWSLNAQVAPVTSR